MSSHTNNNLVVIGSGVKRMKQLKSPFSPFYKINY